MESLSLFWQLRQPLFAHNRKWRLWCGEVAMCQACHFAKMMHIIPAINLILFSYVAWFTCFTYRKHRPTSTWLINPTAVFGEGLEWHLVSWPDNICPLIILFTKSRFHELELSFGKILFFCAPSFESFLTFSSPSLSSAPPVLLSLFCFDFVTGWLPFVFYSSAKSQLCVQGRLQLHQV